MLIGFLLVTLFLKGEKQATHKKTAVFSGERKWSDLFSSGILMLLVLLFMQRIIRTLFNPFIPLYVQELTGTVVGAASTTGTINGLVGFVSALSAVIISRLGDTYNKLTMMLIMLTLGLINVVLLGLTSGLMAFVIFYTLLFFIIGGIEPLLTSATAELTPPEKRGTLFGVQGLVGSLGWMASPAIGTYVSIQFGLHEIFYVLAAIIAINLVMTYMLSKKNVPS